MKRGMVFLGGFLLLIFLVRTVDVAPIGPDGTKIGLSHLNKVVHDLFGVHLLWYDITYALGVLALLTAAAFAAIGLVQLIQRKKPGLVDRQIWALGILYGVVIVLYVFFEKVVVNTRPVIMPGETLPEPSFPSSHTMLVCTVMGSAILVLGKYIKNKNVYRVLRLLGTITMVVTVGGRLFCGVHWFTDILGGVLVSAALLEFFALSV